MGYLPVSFNLDGESSIWIHAVSVGEVLTARALIGDLKRRYPHLRIFLSTTTMSGQQVARRNVQEVDAVFYFPFDLAFIVKRTLRLVKPRLFIMMETEIWPNLLRQCKRRGVATIMVNGRISSRSYPRYKLVRPFFKKVLTDVDRFCMQSEESARRLVDIGAEPARVSVTGSLKFDSLDMPGTATPGRGRDRVLRYFRFTSNRAVIVAGSTMRGEEEALLQVYRRLKGSTGNPLLVLAGKEYGSGSSRDWAAKGPKLISRSMRSRGGKSWSSIRSASWRSCIRLQPRSSSAAASWIPAATISSSPRCSASRSCSARTCRISRRLPRRFCRTTRPSK